MKNVFNQTDKNEIVVRINKLSRQSRPLWGKMSVEQMLAHCNVTYELVYENKHPKPNAVKAFILKLIIKRLVVSEKPYKKNGQTAPEFIIKDSKNFESEKTR